MAENPDALLQKLAPLRKTDPLRFLKELASAVDLHDAGFRFLRAELLHEFATTLQTAMKLCGFDDEIVLRPEGVFVNVGGVLMESSRTGIYLKAGGARQRNQADQLVAALRRFGINVTTAVDIGANFGEISLGLKRAFPAARIVAVEPSSDNSAIFCLNLSAQSFATENVELVQVGITDKTETALMRRGDGAMSRVTHALDKDVSAENVQCERLDTLFDRLGVRTADFVKIDIEGGEPRLREAMVTLGSRVRAYYIEFSQFAPLDDYLRLAAALLENQYACFDESAALSLTSTDEIARQLKSAFAAGPIAVTNLWFVRRVP